jgi:two-component system, chemotaxis family, response regulator Rcp1
MTLSPSAADILEVFTRKEQEEKMIDHAAEIGTPIDVLLVEDSPHYARLIQETFRDINANVNFHMVSDGVEAMDFLEHPGTANPRPDLILLDLGMPKMDGREVLAKLKANDDLKTIPTLVLTTSDMQKDIATSYKLHANSYLQKPLRLEQLDVLVKSINDFWFTQSKLPEKPQMN